MEATYISRNRKFQGFVNITWKNKGFFHFVTCPGLNKTSVSGTVILKYQSVWPTFKSGRVPGETSDPGPHSRWNKHHLQGWGSGGGGAEGQNLYVYKATKSQFPKMKLN